MWRCSYTSTRATFTVDFGEVKTALTECIEKCFQMTPSAYLHYTKAPQNVLMIHLRGQPDESYMKRQFTLKLPDDITMAAYES